MIFTRRSASNQVVTPEDLDLIIQRRLEHFRASLLGKIARVVEAPPEHQILVFDPRSTSSGENTFVISDAPEAIPIKGMSFTIAPQTDEQEIASWMALAAKDTDFLPRPQQLWLLYSKRHSLKLSTPQLAAMVSFSLLAGAPAFYWMRDLSSEVIREAIIYAVRGKSAMNEKECILHTAFFLGKGFFTDIFSKFGKYADRLQRGSKSVGRSGPREWFSPRLIASLKRPEHKSEPQFQNYLETELLRLAVNLGKDQGGVLERTKAKAIDCYLYARDDKYKKDARERQSPETEVVMRDIVDSVE